MEEKVTVNREEMETETEEIIEDTDDIVKEVDAKELEINELKESIQRLQADFNNYRRRMEKEKGELAILANEKLITEFLPVIDNLERALEATTDKENSLFTGVELILKQILDALDKFSVSKIQCDDVDFDPNYHYAVLQEEVEGVDSNKITQVLQTGYILSEKVIRPAMVKVSK